MADSNKKFMVFGLVFAGVIIFGILILAFMDIIPLIPTIIILLSLMGLTGAIILIVYIFKRLSIAPEQPKQAKFKKDEAIKHAIKYVKEIIGDSPSLKNNYPIQWIGTPNTEKSPILRLDFIGNNRQKKYVFIYNMLDYETYWGFIEFDNLIDEKQIKEYIQNSAINPPMYITRRSEREIDDYGFASLSSEEQLPYVPQPQQQPQTQQPKEVKKEEEKKE